MEHFFEQVFRTIIPELKKPLYVTSYHLESKTKKGRGGESESIEYFQLQDLLQSIAKIFSYEMTNKTGPS